MFGRVYDEEPDGGERGKADCRVVEHTSRRVNDRVLYGVKPRRLRWAASRPTRATYGCSGASLLAAEPDHFRRYEQEVLTASALCSRDTPSPGAAVAVARQEAEYAELAGLDP